MKMQLNKSKILSLLILLIFFAQLGYTISNMREQRYNFINYYTVIHNDNGELFGSAENFIQHGFYSEDNQTPYTARIPGISALYIPLRLIFDQNTSFTILTLLPLLSYLIFVLFFFNYLRKRIDINQAFANTLVLLLLTPYSLFPQTSPESHAIVFSIISFLLLFNVFNIKEKYAYFLAGFFFMMAATFRGFLLPSTLALTACLFIILWKQKGLKQAIVFSLIFTTPLIGYFGLWTTRNYLATSEVIVLQKADRHFKSTYKESVQVTKTTFKQMGFETVEFYPNSPMYYLLGRDSVPTNNFYPVTASFGLKRSDIDSLRSLLIKSYQVSDRNLENQIITLNKNIQQTIQSNAGFAKRYLVVPFKNFIRSYTFNFTSGWGLPAWSDVNIIEKLYRLTIWALFHLSMLFSVILSIYSIIRKKETRIPILWLTWVASMFFTFTYLLNQIEFKYYGTLFPLSIIVNSLILIRIKKQKLL